MKLECDGVIFDLDGTLWDSTQALTEVWRLALEGEPDVPRTPTRQELKSVMGMTAIQIMNAFYPHLDEARAMELFGKVSQSENAYLSVHGGELFPGLEETLGELQKSFPLFIVSNCGPEYIPCFLAVHGLARYFSDWECIGRSGLQKWENIRLVAARNGLKRPVYVGDTAIDQASACKAGVAFIHAGYGFGAVEGEREIQSPKELLEILGKGPATPDQRNSVESRNRPA